MNKNSLLFAVLIFAFLGAIINAEPGFNGSSPGCSGTGCHSFQDNIVSVVPLSNLQVQVTLTGTSSNVAGELVDVNGTVVAVMNATSNNPFILTAPSEGTYLINAGYKSPSRRWDSTHVTLQLSVPPTAPSNLAAQFIPNPLSVELNWTDNSNNEDGFIIERESQGPDAFTVIDTVPANTTFFVDNSVTYLTYIYRLTAFNEFGQSAYSDTAQIIVPVELTSFSALEKDAGVLLEWTTATELNNKGFEIQRNISNDWEAIGFVEGKGTTSEITEYQFYNDLSGFIGTYEIQYRLKQIDYNGVFSYSDVVEIEFVLENFALEQNYPNPFNPSTTINFSVPEENTLVSLKIYNSLGQEVGTLINQVIPAGKHEVQFDASSLSSGFYFYTLVAGNFVDSKKMILMK